MNTKKIKYYALTAFVTSNILLSHFHTYAQGEPYVLTSSIIQEPVAKEDCLALIQGQYLESSNSSQSQTLLDQYQQEMTSLEAEYEELVETLHNLTSNPETSIPHAENQLAEIIELVYSEYLQDPEFALLDQEQQLLQVQENSSVLEWQTFIDHLYDQQNLIIARQQEIESQVQTLLFQIEEVNQDIEEANDHSPQLNQCLLYSYSVPRMPMEHLVLDNQTQPLSAYLVSLDTYMKQLVPYAYQKLRFDQIHKAFTKQLEGQALEEALYGKANVEIDDYGLNLYSYAKEFTLLDLEIMANKAQYKYLENKDEAQYGMAYLKLLDLKESQFSYFTNLNPEIWQVIRQSLADYLNTHGLVDQASIDAVSNFHQKYQVKLVLYDDQSQHWSVYDGGDSGYYRWAASQAIDHSLQDPIVNENATLSTTEQDQSSISDANQTTVDSSGDQTVQDQATNNLDYLKEQLVNRNNKSLGTNKPAQGLPSTNSKKTTKDNNTPTTPNKGNLKLPSTGEKQGLMTIAFLILLLGVLVLFINTRIRRKKRDKIEQIELD